METRVIETAREALGDLDEFLSGTAQRRFEPRLTSTLTEREREVLELLAEGFTTGEVAKELSLSEHTVRSRIKAALGKLGARNREHAIAIAIREGAF
jgi:LuxR family transcriptional regulator, quorum-sensing system regulator SdiA